MSTGKQYKYRVTYEQRLLGGVRWDVRFADVVAGPDAGVAVASVLPAALKRLNVVDVRLCEVVRLREAYDPDAPAA